MDINQIGNFDFSQFSVQENKEEVQVQLYAREKSMYLSYVSYGVLFLTIIGVVLVAVLGLPVNNAVWWGIPFYLYTLAHIVAFVFCKKNRTMLKRADEKKEYNNVATAFFILSFMLSFSMMMLFIGRAITPNFMAGF